MTLRSVLLIDDDRHTRRIVERTVATQKAKVYVAGSAEAALLLLDSACLDLIIANCELPDMSCVALLRLLKNRKPCVPVIVVGSGTLHLVAESLEAGAVDFLSRPLDDTRLCSAIEDALAGPVQFLSLHSAFDYDRLGLVGCDARMVEIYKLILHCAGSPEDVLIQGETGTGKEVVARTIHLLSDRASEPFVTVNCPEFSEGLIESELFGHVRGAFTDAIRDRQGRLAAAGRGTIFLDEIGDAPPAVQIKLLRVLQQREFSSVGSDTAVRFHARVIAATHRNLERMASTGDFREDLLYRLWVLNIRVPPLRDRADDIELLAKHFLAEACARSGKCKQVSLGSDAVEALLSYDWPGNVRELEHCMRRAVALSRHATIRAKDILLGPDAQRRVFANGHACAAHFKGRRPRYVAPENPDDEVASIRTALAHAKDNRTKAAQMLNMSRRTLYERMWRYRIESES